MWHTLTYMTLYMFMYIHVHAHACTCMYMYRQLTMSKAVHPVVTTVYRQHGNDPRPRIVPRQLEDDKIVVKPQVGRELDTPDKYPATATRVHTADVTRNSNVSITVITIQTPTIRGQELALQILVVTSWI